MKKISFMIFYILLKNIPGNIYINKLRGMVIGMYAQGTKKNLQIGRAVNIPSPSSLIIGDDVVINSEVYLISGDSTITIGDGCLLAPRCFIQTQNHNYENKSLSIRNQGAINKAVLIGSDCWLACNVVELPGVIINKGCVIGASAVVTKNTESYTVYAGVPAKPLKKRI